MEQIIERLDRIERALKAEQGYLDTKSASGLTGISTVTLEKWRTTGEGPPFVKLGRIVRYRRSDLQDFMDAHLVSPLADR